MSQPTTAALTIRVNALRGDDYTVVRGVAPTVALWADPGPVRARLVMGCDLDITADIRTGQILAVTRSGQEDLKAAERAEAERLYNRMFNRLNRARIIHVVLDNSKNSRIAEHLKSRPAVKENIERYLDSGWTLDSVDGTTVRFTKVTRPTGYTGQDMYPWSIVGTIGAGDREDELVLLAFHYGPGSPH